MVIEKRIDELFIRALSDHKGSMPFSAVRELVEAIKEEVRLECASISYARRYYDEHKEYRRAYAKEYYRKNKERIREKARVYNSEHRAEINARRKEKKALDKAKEGMA